MGFFVCKVAWWRILTLDQLKRRCLFLPSYCYLCKNALVSIDHLLLECSMFFSLYLASIGLSFPGGRVANSLTWKFCGKKRRKAWRTGPLCLFYTIWQEGDQRSFKRVKCSDQISKGFPYLQLIPVVLMISSWWFSNWFSILARLHWEIVF